MEEKKSLRPPYASSGVADAVLDLFRRIVPKRIDNKFIVDNGIATSNNAFTATDLVKWLKITDEEGNVNDEVMGKLKLVGEERENFIRSLVESAYSDLIKNVHLTEAKREDVINYFVHNHSFGTAQARYAAALFLHLCYRYKIPVSEDLTKKTHIGSQKKTNGNIKKKKVPQKSQLRNSDINHSNNPPQGIKVDNGEVVIEIRGANGLYFPLIAKNKSELDVIVNQKIKTIAEAIKLTLPDNNHEDKTDDREEPDLS